MTDYAELIEPVARALRGDPNPNYSKPDDLRFGNHGSLSVVPSTGTWYDHEANVGGGTLALIQHEEAAVDNAGAFAWLVEQGLAKPEPAKRQPQQETHYKYRDAAGNLVFEVVRKVPKDFRQRHPDPDQPGKWIWNMKGIERVPYRLPELLAAPVDSLVFIPEGEKDADRLASLGLVATCNVGGAGKWHKEYSQHLQGRAVVILPDNDQAGRDHAADVAKKLAGIAASVRIVELPGLPEKGDVSDWLAAGHTLADLDALTREACAQKGIEVHGDDGEEKQRKSQADLLVEFVRQKYDLAHDENRDGIAISKATKEAFRLNSRAFRDGLLAGFYCEFEFAARDGSLREAMMTIQALARATDTPRKANLRAAAHGQEYLIDLAKPGDSRAIRLAPGRWEIVDKPGALFIRGDSMLPLVEPVKGGDTDLLWRIVNVPENQRLLVLAWLVDCLRPDTPYPLLELMGEQGSGKSVSSEALRRLIDPNAANLRAEPKSAEDLFVIAHHNHIVALENVSRLTPQQQDSACILATGGGFAKRKLYSDSDETVITLRRPVLINGIVAAVTQQDLVDRCISIDCPVIEARLTSVEMWREFDRNLPRILGGLLDLAAKALEILPRVKLPARERPRLAEYAILGCAVAVAQGHKPEAFMTTFNAMRAETVGRTLEASPVAIAVQELVETVPVGITAPLKDILHELERFKPAGTDAWPRSPKGLGDALRRAAPALRTLGVECKAQPKTGGVIRWKIGQRDQDARKKDQSEVLNVLKSCPDDDGEQDIRTCRTSVQNLSTAQEVF